MSQPYVSDELWELVKPLLPREKNRHRQSVGRKPIDPRSCLEGILFILRTGVPFAVIPPYAGRPSGITCWRRLRDWQKRGVWKKLFQVVLDRLRREGKLDLTRAIVDSSSIRAPGGGRKTGPNPTDRRKKGTKHHVLVDANGIPLSIEITGANRHDVTQLIHLIEDIPEIRGKPGRPRKKPDIVQGDRGYDSEPHRREIKKNGDKAASRKTKNPARVGSGPDQMGRRTITCVVTRL
jgi:transposase